MKQVKVMENCVTLVTIPEFLPVLQWPKIGEYDNQFILKTTPCEKRNGKYYDIRSNTEVKKKDNMLEWPNLSGTFFRYPDGYELLLSKKFEDGKLLVLEPDRLDSRRFHPQSMVLRKIVHRVEKKKF